MELELADIAILRATALPWLSSKLFVFSLKQIFMFIKHMLLPLTWESAFSVRISSSGSSSLQAYAMLTAVSCLSPVSTHICRPAFRRASMVSGTPSCSRSSMPVAPVGRRNMTVARILQLHNRSEQKEILKYRKWIHFQLQVLCGPKINQTITQKVEVCLQSQGRLKQQLLSSLDGRLSLQVML